MKTKKFIKFYSPGISLKQFMLAVLTEYPTLNQKSVKRRYYDCKHTHPFQKSVSTNRNVSSIYIPEDETIEPPRLKKLLIEDASSMNYKLTREFLLKHGFTPYEINWMILHNEVELNE